MTTKPSTSVSVAVVGICSAAHLARCLEALDKQQDAPQFDVVVAYDPALQDMQALAQRYPGVRMVANEGQRSPLELASRALVETTGEITLLTEDHCVPRPDWVANMVAEMDGGEGAVGGVIDVAPAASPVDWAFYFVDFFRYADPVGDGQSPTVSVCNVAYRRSELNRLPLRVPWQTFFHETAVNDALRADGPLRISARARVDMGRHVRLLDAMKERYAFGRLFGCTRLENAAPHMRAVYAGGAPLLGPLLLGRMVRKARQSPQLWTQLKKSWLPLSLMVGCWSAGEWLGYLTGKRPADLTVAQELPR